MITSSVPRNEVRQRGGTLRRCLSGSADKPKEKSFAGRSAELLLVRISSVAQSSEECALVQGAFDSDFARWWVSFNARLRVDAQESFGDGTGAAAASHVWDVETKHRDLLSGERVGLLWGLTAWQGQRFAAFLSY